MGKSINRVLTLKIIINSLSFIIFPIFVAFLSAFIGIYVSKISANVDNGGAYYGLASYQPTADVFQSKIAVALVSLTGIFGTFYAVTLMTAHVLTIYMLVIYWKEHKKEKLLLLISLFVLPNILGIVSTTLLKKKLFFKNS